MFGKLAMYLQYPFVRYALIVGVLIALCSSLLGVTLVLKRFSFIGDGLSHVAFGAMSVAAVLNFTNQMLLVLPITIVSAILLLRGSRNAMVKGDAALAMISVGALAFGYLIMNLFSTSSNLSGDVCSTLFGSTSILTLSPRDVWLCILLGIAVVKNMKKLTVILLCLALSLALAGCGGNEGSSSKTGSNSKGVEDVLEEGMAEADAQTAAAEETAARTGNGEDFTFSSDFAASETTAASDVPETVDVQAIVSSTEGIDVDLTKLSSTMVYSEVYNMMNTPEDYVGKTVKMIGMSATYHDQDTDNYYYACVIADATACCSQGIEYVLPEGQEYPKEKVLITVTGTFDTYQEGEYTYCTLRDAELVQG